MKKLKNYYRENYSVVSVYVIKTALIIMVLGLFVFALSTKCKNAFELISTILTPLIMELV